MSFVTNINNALSIAGQVTVLFTKEYNFPSYGGVTFDSIIDETHVHASKTSSYAIQSGSTIIDNVVKTPTTVRMRVIVTDSPLYLYRGAFGINGIIPANNAFSQGLTGLRSITAMEALIAAQEQRLPLTLVTGIRVYRNMILTQINVPRNHDTGKALFFDLEFTEILLATVVVNMQAFAAKTIKAEARNQFTSLVALGAQGIQAVNPFIRQAVATVFRGIQAVVGRFFRLPF